MKTIGLVGGIASGKSTVAAELAALGATVLDADAAAHQALELPEVKQALVARWGEAILGPSGQVSRSEVARRVFYGTGGRTAELEFLENLLHPQVRRQFQGELAQLAAEGAPAAVIDAPLLLEAGWEDLCDCVVYVDSPAAARVQRGGGRQWTAAEYARREAAQMPIVQKRRRATHVLENSGTRDALRRAVRQFWENLQSGN